MKIALIRKKFAFHGGAERHTSDFVSALVKKGHDVHIFASQWEELKGVTFHKVSAWPLGSFFKTLSFAIKVKFDLAGKSFDITQSNERTLTQDIYRAGDGCHREWLAQRSLYVSPLKKMLIRISPFHLLMLFMEKKIFSKGNYKKIIAISKMGKREIMNHYQVPESDIHVIYNGVDLVKFRPAKDIAEKASLRKEIGIEKDEMVLLFVGSGFERKGLKFLLQAFQKLKAEKIKLFIVGKGKKSKYASFLNSPGLKEKIVFTGIIHEREKVYRCADIFVFPTVYEPFGNVHLEAMATGLPLITTSKSGAAEVIAHKQNGLIIDDPSDVDEIAKNIESLYDCETRKKMGREARKLAEQFTFEKNSGEVLKLYNDVLSIKNKNTDSLIA